jgi:hypothetical protein
VAESTLPVIGSDHQGLGRDSTHFHRLVPFNAIFWTVLRVCRLSPSDWAITVPIGRLDQVTKDEEGSDILPISVFSGDHEQLPARAFLPGTPIRV